VEANDNNLLSASGQRLRAPKRMLSFRNDGNRNVKRRLVENPFSHSHHQVIQRAVASSDGKEDFISSPSVAKMIKRKISEKPTKVLDAPDIVDDYYLDLISWSKDNVLAVAMGPSVYLWNATNGDIDHVVTLYGEDDYVTSVSWSTIPGCTKYLAIGTNNNVVQLWDTEAKKLVRKLHGHTSRVGSMTWNVSKKWLTSGGQDSQILQHDVRAGNHIVARYKGHRQEVCGLKWNEDGHALASGGNENYLCIWDAAMSNRSSGSSRVQDAEAVSPRFLLTQHKAAVKALDWCPFKRDLLASGGGTADRTIKFWNTVSGAVTNSIDTGSQVCSILWSKHQRELCSSHGFSENQLILWNYPTMTKIQEFKGHTARVLNMDMSPDSRTVVSVAADETLRFWDIFGPPPASRRRENFLLGGFECLGTTTIR
jgi:cell division cycle protein 20 (cofactor of APC complex)